MRILHAFGRLNCAVIQFRSARFVTFGECPLHIGRNTTQPWLTGNSFHKSLLSRVPIAKTQKIAWFRYGLGMGEGMRIL